MTELEVFKKDLITESKTLIELAANRPAIVIGQYQDYRDFQYLLMTIVSEFYLICKCKDLIMHDFWVHRNIHGASMFLSLVHDLTNPEEALSITKQFVKDFIEWAKI